MGIEDTVNRIEGEAGKVLPEAGAVAAAAGAMVAAAGASGTAVGGIVEDVAKVAQEMEAGAIAAPGDLPPAGSGQAAVGTDPVPSATEPVAKPWWQSRVILAMIAGLILAGVTRFVPATDLPPWLTQDNIVGFLVTAAPLIAGIVARLRSSGHVLVSSKAKADSINRALS